ncbi:hypothetical protein MTP04_24760 [Lysinibacillus sp. PLM2]|nr:hypothetical protein MTP04_24760 [Lysinibacillus sp. PLM2]
MFYAIGQNSGKVYAVGKYKADCFRILQADYPTCKSTRLKSGAIERVLPEPMKIKRGK